MVKKAPKKQSPAAQESPVPKPPKQEPTDNREWTIMVYLAGDNNLAEEMVYALKSMELVGSNPGQYKVVAFYDAGVRPATIKIPDRVALPAGVLVAGVPPAGVLPAGIPPAGVPPVGAFLNKAEVIRKDEVKQKVQETEDQLKTVTKDVKQTLGVLSNFGTLGAQVGIAAARIQKLVDQAKKLAEDQLDEAKALHKAALDEQKGGPLVIEPVEDSLVDFVFKAIREHPAKYYMLVLSGHGSGTIGDFLSGNKREFGLSIPSMKDSLAEVKRRCEEQKLSQFKGYIDILGLDSCLMGMAEVAFEVRGQVKYLVGAEGFEANTGWPYDAILNFVRDTPGIEPKSLAKGIVKQYLDYYSSDYTLADVSTDITALDIEKIGPLAKALGNARKKGPGLAPALLAALPPAEGNATLSPKQRLAREKKSDPIVLAHWKAQGFKNEQHIDLYDFCSLLEERLPENDRISRECVKVREAIKNLVLASASCGPAFQYAHGVSIFFPWADIADAANVSELAHYKFLKFTKNTGWDEFLARYLVFTRRDVRPPEDGPEVGRLEAHRSALNRREGLFTGKPGKAGTTFNLKAGTTFNLKAGTTFNLKAGTTFNLKGESLPKIASMKNPPIDWFIQHKERE